MVFLDDERLLVAGNNGAKLLRVDVSRGEACVLVEPVASQPGFRAGVRAWRRQGAVSIDGYFHDALQRLERLSIVRYVESGGSTELVHAATLDENYSGVAALGCVQVQEG